jgi:hypothetical protein
MSKEPTERVFVLLCEKGEVRTMRADADKGDECLAALTADKKLLKFFEVFCHCDKGLSICLESSFHQKDPKDIKFLGKQ